MPATYAFFKGVYMAWQRNLKLYKGKCGRGKKAVSKRTSLHINPLGH